MDIGFWEAYWMVVLINATIWGAIIWSSNKMTMQDLIAGIIGVAVPFLNFAILIVALIGALMYVIHEGDKCILWEKKQ